MTDDCGIKRLNNCVLIFMSASGHNEHNAMQQINAGYTVLHLVLKKHTPIWLVQRSTAELQELIT